MLLSILALMLAAAANGLVAYTPAMMADLEHSQAIKAVNELSGFIQMKKKKKKPKKCEYPCNLDFAVMPFNGLPHPSKGLSVIHIALGRGTQNYTCDTDTGESKPQSIGAVATLFNISCVAVDHPGIASQMPAAALTLDLNTTKELSEASGLAPMSGFHYFEDTVTPFFNMDTRLQELGEGTFAKNGSAQAPRGTSAVPWLKLIARTDDKYAIREIYRVDTAGGNAPETCQGKPREFEVQYSAVYWFWAKKLNRYGI